MISSLYIHIPFCSTKCHYCSFNSFSGRENLYQRYIEDLYKELVNVKNRAHLGSLNSVFIGGGTPTVLPPWLLEKLLTYISDIFSLNSYCEFSIESNPGSIDSRKLDILISGGVNRISIGIQSLNDKELSALGRTHSGSVAINAVFDAIRAGFSNINVDLMYGLPFQTPDSWRTSLEETITTGVKHLSLYQLTIEESTPINRMINRGQIHIANENYIEEMDKITAEITSNYKIRQYEISNYAKQGYECLHNINYWKNDEYSGAGAGAVSYINGSRINNVSDPNAYCSLIESNLPLESGRETLADDEAFRESVIMGLRMNCGVNIKTLEKKHGHIPAKIYMDKMRDLSCKNLVTYEKDILKLTAKGRLFANQVMSELV